MWATTTPVPSGKLNPPRKTEDVEKYNAIALKIMADNAVYLDDLHEAALTHQKEWQRPANVHFNEEGSRELTKLVYREINRLLEQRVK